MPGSSPTGCAPSIFPAPNDSARTSRWFERRTPEARSPPLSRASSWRGHGPPTPTAAWPIPALASDGRSASEASEPRDVRKRQLVVVNDHASEFRAPPQLGKHLAGIEQVIGIERAFQPHLL